MVPLLFVRTTIFLFREEKCETLQKRVFSFVAQGVLFLLHSNNQAFRETGVSMETMAKYVLGNDLSIVCSDTYHKLLCNEHIVPLTPTEYRICRLFLKENAQLMSFHTEALVFPYIQRTNLQQWVGISNKQLLRKHISNANAKLAPYHLYIRSFEQGYVFINQQIFMSAGIHQ
jgi:hypothetical protein